jgi:hypothetical protein
MYKELWVTVKIVYKDGTSVHAELGEDLPLALIWTKGEIVPVVEMTARNAFYEAIKHKN